MESILYKIKNKDGLKNLKPLTVITGKHHTGKDYIKNKINDDLENRYLHQIDKGFLQVSLEKELKEEVLSQKTKDKINKILQKSYHGDDKILLISAIEENMHPITHPKLLEFLSITANNGAKVVLCTFSCHLLYHLNNITLDVDLYKEDFDMDLNPYFAKTRAIHLYTQEPKAFILKENIDVLDYQKGNFIDRTDPDYGFQFNDISDVATEVHHKYFAIFAKKK